MLIGKLAKATDTKVNTIRFYEEIGLLPVPARTDSGQRVYQDADVRLLSFIRHARALGFSTEEVRSLLTLREAPEKDCSEAVEIASHHLAEVDRRLLHLTRLRDELQQTLASCSGGSISNCAIINRIARR